MVMALIKFESFGKRINKNNLFTYLIIILLLFTGLNLREQIFQLPFTTAMGESGSPPENGSTLQHWYIEADDEVHRLNEKISTVDITLNNTAIMYWENITAKIAGEIFIKSDAVFQITNCNLVLMGNLTINGLCNVINSTILVNCSTMGEYFISVEKGDGAQGGTIQLSGGALITGASSNLRIRILWVDPVSKFIVENGSFNFVGWNSKRSGILIESHDSVICNCSFLYCYNAVTFLGGTAAKIVDCEFIDCHYGLNLTNSSGNIIRNCLFFTNECGIFAENSNLNLITGSDFLSNSQDGIILKDYCNNNTIKNCLFDNNNQNGIYIENNSNNNHVYLSTFQNNNNGVMCARWSKHVKIINSSLIGSTSKDFYIAQSSELTTLNTSFNGDDVQVDLSSNFSVQWFLHIFTQNSTSALIPDVNLLILDNTNGTLEFNTTTDDHGWRRYIACTEYYLNGNSKTYLTPHTVVAKRFGFATNTSQIVINSSKIFNITLNQTLPFIPDLIPFSIIFSNDYPLRNETITITTVVKNVGVVDFNNNKTNVTVALYLDDGLINSTTNLSSLPMDAVTEISVQLQILVPNGTHIINVTIDVDGNLTEINETNNTISRELIVNSIPIAKLKIEPTQALTYEKILFDASESYNEVADIGVQYYYYDFDDGTLSNWRLNDTIYHSYTDNGTYYVSVKVRDISNQTSAWSTLREIKISNRAPIANFTIEPSSGSANTVFVFNSGISSDIDGTITGYYWEFSDGINSTKKLPSHSFEDDIEYSISLSVWDNDGAQSKKCIKKIKLRNLPPIATFKTSPQNGNASEEIIFDATGTTDPDDELSTLDYTWDFEDGTFGYEKSIIEHSYSDTGRYNVTLYVTDDDNETGVFIQLIIINESTSLPSTSNDDQGMLWAAGLVVMVLIIFFVLIMLVFVTQSRKLRKQLAKSKEDGQGSEGSSEFTTAGKLDFVILKKPVGKRYIKFELHGTTKSTGEYVGLIWRSALLNSSWVIIEKQLGSKSKVIDYLQLKVLAYNSKNWVIDYSGNGTILASPKNAVLSNTPEPKPPKENGING